jgi:hypothetical protein
VHNYHKIENLFSKVIESIKYQDNIKTISRQYQDNIKTMFSNLTTSEISLKVINICLLLILLLRKLFSNDNKTEPDRDPNKWYEIAPGRLYKGEWLNGLPHGRGMKEYIETKGDNMCDHSIVIGNFVNGKTHGRAIQVYDMADYDTKMTYYEGDFENNKEHGKGMYHFGNGSLYEGEFNNGKYEGEGKFISIIKNNITYGIYKNNELVKTIRTEIRK